VTRAAVQSLADSSTEEEFNRRWKALDNDGIWTAHPNLSAYIYHQWVKDDKYKVCTRSRLTPITVCVSAD